MVKSRNSEPFIILVAEDEKTDSFFLQEASKHMSCVNHVHVVTDGAQAMDFLKRRGDFSSAPRPDILLLDINMPGRNGHDVLQDVKSDPELQHLPVIVLSGSFLEKEVKASYASLANAYVVKADNFEDMCLLMRSIEVFWFQLAVLPRK